VKYPREIRLVDAIPLTSVMKTDRKLLRAMLASDRAEGDELPGSLAEEPPTIP
jgi:acyl-coenzyme A synthetase/AMP-(fatty) acid ligase